MLDGLDRRKVIHRGEKLQTQNAKRAELVRKIGADQQRIENLG